MSETRIQQYEGMFLFPQSVTSDLEAAAGHIREILERHQGAIESLVKWDERRLAYDIKGNKRGVYFLCYFKAPTAQLAEIERDCRLSERLLRSLITRADHLTQEQLKDAEGQARLALEARLRKAEPAIGELPEATEVQGVAATEE